MAKEKGEVVLKRIWVKTTEETRLRLAHLAIDLGISTERLGGAILADVLPRLEIDMTAARKLVPPPAPKKPKGK